MIKKIISMLRPRATIQKLDDDFYTRMVLSGAFYVTERDARKCIDIRKVAEDQEGIEKLQKLVNDIKVVTGRD